MAAETLAQYFGDSQSAVRTFLDEINDQVVVAAPAPAPKAAETAPAALPKTASNLPLIGLLGVLFCALSLMAVAIRTIVLRSTMSREGERAGHTFYNL